MPPIESPLNLSSDDLKSSKEANEFPNSLSKISDNVSFEVFGLENNELKMKLLFKKEMTEITFPFNI